MKYPNAGWLLMSVSALSLAMAGAAHAEQAATSTTNDAAKPATSDAPVAIEEIIVTATRQEQSLSKVPVSVVAYTQEKLDKQSVRSFSDVAKLTPGLTFSRGARGNSSMSSVSIRGISSGAGTATVGVYIDDTPIQQRPGNPYSASNGYPKVFDLERVEVLRGPQGTLFGVGSEGGTIRFITPDPSLTNYKVYARTEMGFTDGGDPSYEAGVAVGGPIVQDKLGFRASVSARRDGGFVDRINWNTGATLDKNSNWSDSYTARLALKWAATENLTITPSIFLQKVKTNDSSTFWESFSNLDDNKLRNGNPVQTPSNDRFSLAAVKADWDLGPVRLLTNTSFYFRTNDNIFDSTTLDMTSLGGVTTITPPSNLKDIASTGYLRDKQRVFTQEVRLQSNNPDSRLNWSAGVFFQKSFQSSYYLVANPQINAIIANGFSACCGWTKIEDLPFFGNIPLYGGQYVLYSTGSLNQKEISAFGQADFKITDKLKATAGVRIASNKYNSTSFSAGPVMSSNGTIDNTRQSDKPITPKFGLSYQADDATMYYVSAAKGYRQGGTAADPGVRCLADMTALGIPGGTRQIRPDTVWSYELGGKKRMNGGRFTLDGSVYRIDWDDIQSGFTLPNCNIPTTANLGKARSEGFDLQANAVVFDGFTVGLSVGYSDARYTTATLGAINTATGKATVVRSKGEPLPIAPWSVALSAQYDFNLLNQNAYVRADYQYQSHDGHPLDLASSATDPTLPRAPELNNLDLRAGIKLNGFDLSLFATNLTNDLPEYGRYRDSLTTFNYRGVTVRPRTVGATMTYRY